MCFDFPLGQFAKIDERYDSYVFAGCCEYEVVDVTGEWDHIVDLVFLESKGFDDMFDL